MAGHKTLVTLEQYFDVQIITQNVDDLHERAGSRNIMHLHGELRKVRSKSYPDLIYERDTDIQLGDTCARGAQLRPHIVWFGESVPLLELAAEATADADILLIVGTSLQVYPAASLMQFASRHIPVYYVDPHPQVNAELARMPNLTIIAEPASTGVEKVLRLVT